MTDKLYLDATTACHLNQQPNTFMRSQHLRKICAFLCLIALFFSSTRLANAQILVGTNGSSVDAFGGLPPATSWSTRSLAGGSGTPEDDGGMDTMINGAGNGAATITAQVSSVT